MIALFDTNVLIAALVTEGMCSRLLHRARKKEFSLVTCPLIISEFKKVLKKKFNAPKDEIADAVDLILDAAESIDHSTKVKGACRDKDDDNVLACALAVQAGYLVTGVADLLEMGSYESVTILSPRDFEMMFE